MTEVQSGRRESMRNRTVLLIVGIVVFVLLATGGTVGVMALTHSGVLGNGYRMMSRQQTYRNMMNGQPGYQGMMGGQYNHGSMMGGYQQTPAQQGAPVTGSTHLTIDIVTNQPGMQKDWPAFSPSHLVVPANSLMTVTIRDYDLGDTAMPQDSPFTSVQGTVGTSATANGREYASLAPEKIAHTFTIP